MSDSVLRDLRDLRVQVIHPPDDEGKNLVDHLKRIGCMVEGVWPIPEAPSEQADIVMLAIDFDARDAIRRLLRGDGVNCAALIAIVDYENPSTLQLVLESRALAVTEKPIRPSACAPPSSWRARSGWSGGARAGRSRNWRASSPASTRPSAPKPS